MTQERKPRRGDVCELTIERFDERGEGVGRSGEYKVELRRALPGERVRAEVSWRRRNTLGARVLERLDPGPHAVPARCAHFGVCGGCSFQSLDYAAQLAGLHALVARAFAAAGFGPELEIAPVEGAHELYGYRNKMEFTFGNRRYVERSEPEGVDTSFALGLHAPGMYSKVIDVSACPIQPPALDAILATLRSQARARALEPWDQRLHTGLLRHAVLRSSRSTGEILVDLVTSTDAPELVDPYARAVLERHPEITTFVQNVNTRLSQTAQGERERVIFGPGSIVERLLGLEFAISANSFFQTNPAQAQRLFEIVREEAGTNGSERVYDLYCGTGTIALVLAGGAREVAGFELAPSSVADARANAARNGIENVRFVEGDVLESLRRESARADVCVVDPPRAGLHPKLLPVLAALAPRRIVYVSCNPVSGARDARALCAAGYTLARVRPIDLFPHTPHVESVFALERAP
ncbi:MAG: 23S rRNA (uracil(1939)-C(5))-methyltransferase RlmD [Planctomycetes bacterium]|nr:23S rRNA (uracil(1939)-C(5))-methyltransferase RlmD [Planctomycetota bacterium]